jgi:hypothetical protein
MALGLLMERTKSWPTRLAPATREKDTEPYRFRFFWPPHGRMIQPPSSGNCKPFNPRIYRHDLCLHLATGDTRHHLIPVSRTTKDA